jgi:hypothetical protein
MSSSGYRARRAPRDLLRGERRRSGLHLEARDARSGELRWSSPWNAYSPHDVRLIGQTLLLHTFESGATIVGELYAYDVLSGRPLWTKGNVNTIVGVDGEQAVAVDVTRGPTAYANYEPLTTDTIALADGAGQGTNALAPDPDRWNTSTGACTSHKMPRLTAMRLSSASGRRPCTASRRWAQRITSRRHATSWARPLEPEATHGLRGCPTAAPAWCTSIRRTRRCSGRAGEAVSMPRTARKGPCGHVIAAMSRLSDSTPMQGTDQALVKKPSAPIIGTELLTPYSEARLTSAS